MKVFFIGCVESSYRLLEILLKTHKDVSGVITKEKSDFNSDFCDLTPLCRQYKVPYLCVKNANDVDSISFIREVKADICFCFGWSQLLKDDLINLFPMGVVGFHPAALPCNRGRHPLIWALALGLEETASSFFMINAEADKGDIVSQRSIEITYEDDAGVLYDKVMAAAIDQEMELVKAFEDGTVSRIPQLSATGNSWRKRGKADGAIDWRMSSRNIYNLVRSLAKPYVGAHFVYDGKEYKVWKVKEIDTPNMQNLEPGKVIAVNSDGTVDVKAGDGGVRLLEFDTFKIKAGDYIL